MTGQERGRKLVAIIGHIRSAKTAIQWGDIKSAELSLKIAEKDAVDVLHNRPYEMSEPLPMTQKGKDENEAPGA